jgi:tRNA nucleotidyltransferase (CCA-adding enzyme)
MTIRLFEVGGCVRDELLGKRSKDVDFAVEAPSFEAMAAHIDAMGLKVFLSKPEFLTIRAGVPNGHALRERCKDADFVLCRKDGPSFDGRRPDFVESGTIFDDLARRDFTVNAIARCAETGDLIDPHGGRDHLSKMELHFVGDPMTRIREDGLRVLRGLRFSITKGLRLGTDTDTALGSQGAAAMLFGVSTERVREELDKMFAHDTLAALRLLEEFRHIREACFSRPDLTLMATMKQR